MNLIILRYPHDETLHPWLFKMRRVQILISANPSSPDMALHGTFLVSVLDRVSHPGKLPALSAALQEERQRIPHLQHLIWSMRRHCTACISAAGGHTRH